MAVPWVIRKRGYFYRPNRSGYTSSPHDAGHYTEDEAKAEAAVEPWHMTAMPLSQAMEQNKAKSGNRDSDL